MNNYPIIRFIARHGMSLAWLVGALCILAAAALAFLHSSALYLAVGGGAALVVLGILLTMVELVRVIADTLLPR